jgi:mitogen-activated protein kinase kinase
MDHKLTYHKSSSLHKEPSKRPTYAELLEHPFIQKYHDVDVDMESWATQALESRQK